MTVVTAEKLSAQVGAEVIGIDCDRLLHDDALPAWTLEALDTHGALVFRGVHVDDDVQVAFSRRLGRVETFGTGDHPEIFLVTLDPARNPAAAYLRGTFDWHIDGCTDDVPIMATMLSAHAVADSGGETEFASTYAAYDALSEEEKKRLASLRVVHTIEASQRLVNNDPSPEELALWRSPPTKEHPLVWTHQSGRTRWCSGPPLPTWPAWTSTRDGLSWPTCWLGPPPPITSTGTNGRSVTWSSGTTGASSTVPAGANRPPLATCTGRHSAERSRCSDASVVPPS